MNLRDRSSHDTPFFLELAEVFSNLCDGRYDEARTQSHRVANRHRWDTGVAVSSVTAAAGRIWRVANALSQARLALEQRDLGGVQAHAETAAAATRRLVADGAIEPQSANQVLALVAPYISVEG